MKHLDMHLYKRNGEIAGLKDVMRWFIENYPRDIYTSDHPVHIFRNYCYDNKDKLEEK